MTARGHLTEARAARQPVAVVLTGFFWRWANATAVVTGASRAFGRGIALTRAGAQVVGVARDHPQLIDAPERMF